MQSMQPLPENSGIGLWKLYQLKPLQRLNQFFFTKNPIPCLSDSHCLPFIAERYENEILFCQKYKQRRSLLWWTTHLVSSRIFIQEHTSEWKSMVIWKERKTYLKVKKNYWMLWKVVKELNMHTTGTQFFK